MFRRSFMTLAAVSSLWACAHTPPPHHVRFAEFGSGKHPWDGRAPLIIEFQAGDRIPVDFAFDGEDFELAPPHPPLEFVAKHHCYVRISQDGIHTSLDPAQFDVKPRQPGSFRFGLSAGPGRLPRVEARVSTPRR